MARRLLLLRSKPRSGWGALSGAVPDEPSSAVRMAFGRRLDIPAGTAVRFEPGETKTVTLVDIAGARVIRGGNAIVDGPVNDQEKTKAMQQVTDREFAHKT